jgi:uroporphyrinogen decarboxylase
MNGYQRVMAALRGEPVDITPVLLHNFMMAADENGVSMGQFRREAKLAADSFIHSIEKYQLDGIMMDFDTVTLAGAIGVPVDFPEEEPARAISGLLSSLEAVNDLKPVDLANNSRIQVWLETASRLVDYFGQEIAIRGNCDQAPFTLASMVRGADLWLMDLTDSDNETLVTRLLDYCTGVSAQFIRLMAKTGVHIVSNGDSVAGPDVISARFYKKFAFEYEKRMVDTAAEANCPYILHICGNTTRILPDMVKLGAAGLELDYKTNAQAIHDTLKDQSTLLGTIDPVNVLAYGTPELVSQKVQELLELFSDTSRLIINAGCAIPPKTPSENLQALVKTAHGQYN